MQELIDYVLKHTTRGKCQCGVCLVSAGTPEEPSGHTINMTFFTVGLKGTPTKSEFQALVKEHLQDLYPLIQKDYMFVGRVMGDQGIALLTMGLGHLLGIWRVISPDTEYPDYSQEKRMEMAGYGGVIIQTLLLDQPHPMIGRRR